MCARNDSEESWERFRYGVLMPQMGQGVLAAKERRGAGLPVRWRQRLFVCERRRVLHPRLSEGGPAAGFTPRRRSPGYFDAQWGPGVIERQGRPGTCWALPARR
jgi:hypothetical protein